MAPCILSFLPVGPLGPGTAPAQIFTREAERSPKGKPGTKADYVLTVKDNRISLKAKDVSLIGVLEEIGRKMNIEVLGLLREQEKITVDFEQLPLEEAIKRCAGLG